MSKHIFPFSYFLLLCLFVGCGPKSPEDIAQECMELVEEGNMYYVDFGDYEKAVGCYRKATAQGVDRAKNAIKRLGVEETK